ncbi:MAG: hypothetical protein IIC50_03785 [Planctomycetes bacterium]|nr:hypothetical protein [Planctomycetota bacterium]
MLFRKIRKIVAVLRGQVSPVLAGLAVGLGFWFGLTPGFYGIHACLAVLLVLLNLPVGMFILSVGIGKAASLAAAPLLYHLGLMVMEQADWLLDINRLIPVVAITDFSRPALVGTLLVGPVSGLVLGSVMGFSVLGFRKTWLKLQGKSAKFEAWQNQGWVRLLDRIVVGKRASDAAKALAAKTKPLRTGGVILAVILLLCFGLGATFLKDRIRTKAADRLTRVNGATVDLGALSLSLLTGKVALRGLALTDTDNLQQNKLQIAELSSQANVYQMSLGKLVMEEVRVSGLRFDQPRQSPGSLVAKPDSQGGESDGASAGTGVGIDANDLDKLEGYFENAKKIKAWIEKIRPWLPDSEEKELLPPEPPPSYLSYLAARVDTLPKVRVLVKRILLDQVQLNDPQFGLSDITITNLNDAPMAAKLPIAFELQSQQGPRLQLTLHFEEEETAGRVTGAFTAIDLAKLQQGLKRDNDLTFQQGKASGTITGFLNRDRVDLTIGTTLSGLQASTGRRGFLGLDAKTANDLFEQIDDLELSLRLVGPITAPRLVFDSKALQETLQAKLLDLGKQKAADELKRVIDKNLGHKVPEEIKAIIDTGNGNLQDSLQKGLKALFGGRKKKE